MSKTKIEWTNESWNPVTGCRHGCSYCYAHKWAMRLKAMGQPKYNQGFKPTFHYEELYKPLHWRKQRMVFVCSMGDLFGDWVPWTWIADVVTTAEQCPDHTFQFLTKNPKRLKEVNPWPGNCWVGATATDYTAVFQARDDLQKVEASIRFVSLEPLQESVSLYPISFVDWLIVGKETRNGRPVAGYPDLQAALSLVHQAHELGIPVFVKDNVPWTGKRPQQFPDDRR